jgi:OOP family OmpA-OmpF porin
MKNFQTYIFTALCLVVSLVSAQESMELTAKDSIVKSSWMVGLGFNIVDDSGDMMRELFAVEEQLNAVAFPSRISIGRYFNNGFGLEAIGTYNKYKVGKLIDGEINDSEKDYFGADARLSYDMNKIIGETGWFDPYVGVGVGYTKANNLSRGTYNAVVGFRTWFNDRLALDLNSSGKWSMGNEATNHLQHAIGAIYQFDIEKDISKKGLEKLALLEEIAKEQQRVQDSMDVADRAKELAKRMAEELEASRLAAAENARIEAENRRRAQIENDIENLGEIYFAFNSSTLNTESKATLSQLVTLMDATPSITLEVASYTDSRGPANYNLGLSERRVKTTIDYLLGQGLASDRLVPKAYGETNLVNECDDNTPCSAVKHRLNRRSEFMVINFK